MSPRLLQLLSLPPRHKRTQGYCPGYGSTIQTAQHLTGQASGFSEDTAGFPPTSRQTSRHVAVRNSVLVLVLPLRQNPRNE